MASKGEFMAFMRQYGVIGMAVGIVMGGAVAKLVTALVADIAMPIIGIFVPGGNWREAVLSIGTFQLKWGDLLGALVDFVVIAYIIFIFSKKVLKEEEVTKK